MDITSLKDFSYRMKGKQATVTLVADGTLTIEDRLGESSYTVRGPGEYEVKGVGVIGVAHDQTTMYRCEIDGVSIVYTGVVTTSLSPKEIEAVDGADILITPLVSVVHEIEPSIVIPMVEEGTARENFLKEIGKQESVGQAKLTITKDKIPEQMQVCLL